MRKGARERLFTATFPIFMILPKRLFAKLPTPDFSPLNSCWPSPGEKLNGGYTEMLSQRRGTSLDLYFFFLLLIFSFSRISQIPFYGFATCVEVR